MNIWLAISHKSAQVITVGMSDGFIFHLPVRIDAPRGPYPGNMADLIVWMSRGGGDWENISNGVIDNKDLRFGELRL